MANLSIPARDSVEAQRDLFRRAERELGLSITVIAKRRDALCAATMRGWRDGSVMPAWALGELAGAGVTDDILSLVLDPYSRHVGTNGDDSGLDDLADDVREFLHEHGKARSPNSPGGVQIVPQERAVLVPLAGRVKARARRAA